MVNTTQKSNSVTFPWHRKQDAEYKASIPGLYFHQSRERPDKLFGGAVGGTKTTTLATECIYLSLEYPNNRGFVGERDFDDLRRGLYNEILEWLPENQKLADGRDLYQHNKSEHWIRFYNGSEMHFIELKEEPRNVNLGWFAIDQAERVPEKSYEWAHTRLRLEHVDYRPLMLSANPEPGWVYRKFVEHATPVSTGIFRKNGTELVVYHKGIDSLFIPSFPEDNEHLPDGYIDSLYAHLSPTLVDRLLRGIWTVVENAIYPQLERSIQMQRLPRNAVWVQGGGGADFGKEHLSAVVAVTKSLDGSYWVRECWAEPGGDSQRIEDTARGQKIRYQLTCGCTDPLQEVLAQKLGYRTAKQGAGSREARISNVTKLLNAGLLLFDVDGPGVQELFDELLAYRREFVETETKAANIVVRKNDDRVAALEYAIEAMQNAWDYQPPTTRVIKWAQRTFNPRPAPSVFGNRLGKIELLHRLKHELDSVWPSND